MGVSKITEVICDYSGCKAGQNGPLVVVWNDTRINDKKDEVPELAKYIVAFTQGDVTKSFCCQLHAAEYFLPPGYEAVQKKVIELPSPKRSHHKKSDWKDEPQRVENPLSGQDQADGFGPEAA